MKFYVKFGIIHALLNTPTLTMNKILPFVAFYIALSLSFCSSNGQDVFPIVRYQKDDNTYFMVVEVRNGNFNESKSKFSRQATIDQGAKVDAYETVKYNGFEGQCKHEERS